MTGHGTPVMALEQGDLIHVGPHCVWRHSKDRHPVRCSSADVRVDCIIPVGEVVVICWHAAPGAACPRQCGAVVYDRDDSVVREVAAA